MKISSVLGENTLDNTSKLEKNVALALSMAIKIEALIGVPVLGWTRANQGGIMWDLVIWVAYLPCPSDPTNKPVVIASSAQILTKCLAQFMPIWAKAAEYAAFASLSVYLTIPVNAKAIKQ